MTTEKEILEKRNEVYQAQRDLGQRIATEKRAFNDEERVQFEAAEKDYKALTEQLEVHRSLNEKASQQAEAEYRAKHTGARAPEDNEQMGDAKAPEYRDVFSKLLRDGRSGLSREENEVAREFRAQSKGTNTAGGFLAPEEWTGGLITKMEQYGGMMQAANVINTANGNKVYFPIFSDLTNVGEILGENAAASTQDVAFDQVAMESHKYSSKIVLVSMELAQDETYGLNGIITDAFARRIGVLANQHFTNGDGTNKPRGVITDIPAGLAFVGGAADALTRSDIIRTKGKVDPAYRVPGSAFMMNDSTLTEIKLLTVGSGDDRPLWVPSMTVGAPDTIDGSRYFINQEMDGLGASNTPLLFGDFSKYTIRIAKGFEVFRFGEKYMNQGSIGYLAFARMDGRLLDTSAIAKFTNAAS